LQQHNATRLVASNLKGIGLKPLPLWELSQNGWFFDWPQAHHQYSPAANSNTAGFLSAIFGSFMGAM